MIHLTIQQLSTYFDGELSESSAALVRQHCATCDACARRYAALEAQGKALAKALAREPDGAFFERLTREIEEGMRPERSVPALPRALPERERAAAALVDADAEGPGAGPLAAAPPPRRAEWDRATGRRTGPRIPWGSAAVMVLVAASAGVVLSRVGRLTPPPAATESKPAEAGAPATASPPGDPAPARRAIPEAEPAPDADAPPPPSAVDRSREGTVPEPEATEPSPTPADDALSGVDEEREAGLPAAENYEVTAARWEEELPSLRGEEYRAARFRLAEARYRAWTLAPNGDRAARAEAAIRAYLVTAPKSEERDDASRWLSRVEEAGFR